MDSWVQKGKGTTAVRGNGDRLPDQTKKTSKTKTERQGRNVAEHR